jgi:hypothetical protein
MVSWPKAAASLMCAGLLTTGMAPEALFADSGGPPESVSTMGSPVQAAALNAATVQATQSQTKAPWRSGGVDAAGVQVAGLQIASGSPPQSASTMGSKAVAAQLNAATWQVAVVSGYPPSAPTNRTEGAASQASAPTGGTEVAGVQVTQSGDIPETASTLGEPSEAAALNAATEALAASAQDGG